MRKLTAKGYIVPGLGDAGGGLAFGTSNRCKIFNSKQFTFCTFVLSRCLNELMLLSYADEKTIIIIISGVCFKTAVLQDPNFSQFLYLCHLNPALTGKFNGNFREAGNYRDQWPAISKGLLRLLFQWTCRSCEISLMNWIHGVWIVGYDR